MKKLVLSIIALFLMLIASLQLARGASDGTWSVVESGEELRIHYGRNGSFPQYAVLHRNSSYFRLIPSPLSGWGTSIVLLPAFWSGGDYYQGAPVSATWQVVGPNLTLQITGSIASLAVSSTVSILPPTGDTITAYITTTVIGSVPLDNRPGEAFKPVMLSSMHISPTVWDTQAAFADSQVFSIPASDWLIPPQPPIIAGVFGLRGGTSSWKTNAPTITVELDQPRQIAGWVKFSTDPNDDNIGLWAASNEVLPSWSYKATSTLEVHRLFLPVVLK